MWPVTRFNTWKILMVCVTFLVYSNLYCSWITQLVELNKLHNWIAINKLSLSINKTNYMDYLE